MMKLLVPFLFSLVFMASCVKKDTTCRYVDSTTVAPASEVSSLQDSLAMYGITALPHSSGFFYKINSAGSAPSVANLCTTVTVTYKGQLFNGNVFDSTGANLTASFQLGQVIVGWQKGVPLVNKGGDIDLYIPPSLGYGPNAIKDNNGTVIIPANSYLVFNVHVVDIQ